MMSGNFEMDMAGFMEDIEAIEEQAAVDHGLNKSLHSVDSNVSCNSVQSVLARLSTRSIKDLVVQDQDGLIKMGGNTGGSQVGDVILCTSFSTQSAGSKRRMEIQIPHDYDAATATNDSMEVADLPAYKKFQQPPQEFLMGVEFHHCGFAKGILPDHPALPPVLRPYMTRDHWRKLMRATARLATRNYRVGTYWGILGLLLVTLAWAAILYGVIPMEGVSKLCAMHVAVGTGAASLVAGVCLLIWARANRGGSVFVQDLQALCANASEQLKGVTIQYQSASAVLAKKTLCRSCHNENKDRCLVFGLEIFCLDNENETETDPTDASRSTYTCATNMDADHVRNEGYMNATPVRVLEIERASDSIIFEV